MQILMNVLKTLMGVDRCAQIQSVVTHALAVLAIVWQVMVTGVMVSDSPIIFIIIHFTEDTYFFRY